MIIVDKHRLYSYFAANWVLKKSTNGWWAFDNPFDPTGDGKKKMNVHFGRQQVKCWITEWRGSIIDFVMEYEGKEYFDAKNMLMDYEPANVDLESVDRVDYEIVADVQMPVGYVPLMMGQGTLATRAQNYLLERGFDLAVMDRMGVGYCNEVGPTFEEDYYGYLIIPFKKRGVLQYFIGRDFIGNFLRYKNPPESQFGVGKSDILFNEDALELYRVNYIFEGWSDALTIGKEATATLGWSMSPKQKSKYMQSNASRLVFGPDKGFYKQAVKAAMDFMDQKEVYVVDIEPYCEGEQKDANNIGREKFMQAYKETKPMNMEQAMDILMS